MKDKLAKIYIKNCTCYYFDHIIKVTHTYFIDNLLGKYYMKTFQFMIFHTKPQQTQNHCVLDSIKQMDLLGFVAVNLDIQYYLIMDCLINGTADSINHNFGEIKIDSFNYSPKY